MKALAALLVEAAATGACGGKTETPPAAKASPNTLTRELGATVIGAKVADPMFGREYSVQGRRGSWRTRLLGSTGRITRTPRPP